VGIVAGDDDSEHDDLDDDNDKDNDDDSDDDDELDRDTRDDGWGWRGTVATGSVRSQPTFRSDRCRMRGMVGTGL
jgi:hypothetical protein